MDDGMRGSGFGQYRFPVSFSRISLVASTQPQSTPLISWRHYQDSMRRKGLMPLSMVVLGYAVAVVSPESRLNVNPEQKKEWLDFVTRMQRELASALNSLGGKDGKGLPEQFVFYSAVQINRAVLGYIVLAHQDQPKSAVLLVRPALEAMFRLQAVRVTPALVCRIAATEKDEEEKMVRSMGRLDADQAVAALKSQWTDFEQKYVAKYGADAFCAEKISVYDVAKAAGMEHVYNAHYRLYCKFTHAALRAAVGGFDAVTMRDAPLLAACTGAAIEAMGALGADIRGYVDLQREFQALNTRDLEDAADL
jgi:hypothetical protein